ncbi:MAG: GNAT family N-acetyltransferase [Brachybacterium sp.]
MTGSSTDRVRIASHDADGAVPFRDRVLEVWKLAFGPVEDEGAWRGRFWEQHRRRAGFRLVAAELEDELVGFGWGYTGERGQWWADSVAGALGADARKWVGGHLEFVELAVLPDHQGRGIGGQLHDALLRDLPHERALLQTDADSSSAGHSLYIARGWDVVGRLPGEKVVMGKHLP